MIDDLSRPVPQAEVRAKDSRGVVIATTSSDNQGKYVLDHLPSGQLLVWAAKDGLVTTEYGQTRAFEPSTSIALADGESATANFRLLKSGSLSGTVIDDAGRPVSQSVVSLLRRVFDGGRLHLQSVAGMQAVETTDDRGAFRFYGIPEGEYFIRASRDGSFSEAVESGRQFGYERSYYPGFPDFARAQAIRVAVGDSPALRLRIQRRPIVRLSGFVENHLGKRVTQGAVRLSEIGAPISSAEIRPVENDGRFQFDIVATPATLAITASTRPAGSRDSQSVFEAGRTLVTVGASNQNRIVIRTRPGGSITGRVATDHNLTFGSEHELRVTAKPLRDEDTFPVALGVPVAPDGRFELRNVFWPSLVVPTWSPTAPFELASIHVKGANILDTLVDPSNHAVSGVDIALRTKRTELRGLVAKGDGSLVIVFAQDESRWTHPLQRYVRVVRAAGGGGTYSIVGMPEGRYFAIAMKSMEGKSAADPEFLRTLRSLATLINIPAGESISLNLALSAL